MPWAISKTEHISIPIPMSLGNRLAPKFWPGITGKDSDIRKTRMEKMPNIKPMRASLIFIVARRKGKEPARNAMRQPPWYESGKNY
jgi:hypothetical protein